MGDLCAEIQKLGKGIGNNCRYRVLEALSAGPKTVGQLVKSVKMSQPSVSQHLKVLKNSNLVIDEKKGKEVYYSLNSGYMLSLLDKFARNLKKK
ncbi:MAG: metalloregulator ArsR/SmtB family transcription factor [Patescibacteria group bacterium]